LPELAVQAAAEVLASAALRSAQEEVQAEPLF
jgi:hypothetical protein